MTMYTFRLIREFRGQYAFECSKWGDKKEPDDVYILTTKNRSISCNCYARGECKHKELVREILSNDMQYQMHSYTWDYNNTWLYAKDLDYA